MRDRNGRYPPGYSGNRGGRPLKYPDANVSLIELLNKPEKIKQNGVEHEYTAKEAMLLRSIQDVLGRKPGVRAIKLVLNAIVELQVARKLRDAPEEPKRKSHVIEERDTDNAFEAMCLLGIAVPNPDYPDIEPDIRTAHDGSVEPPNCHRIKLTQRIVDAAISRDPTPPEDEHWWITLRAWTDRPEDPFSQRAL